MRYIFCLLFTFAFLTGIGQNNPGYGFIENKGQIKDQFNEQNNSVRFLYPSGKGLNVQLTDHGFSYDLYKYSRQPSKALRPHEKAAAGKRMSAPHVKGQRIDFKLKNMNPNFYIVKEDPGEEKLNFYYGNTQAVNVQQFHQITYKEIYPSIDLVFSVSEFEAKFKYDFVIHPGGDISDIQLEISGYDALEVDEHQLSFSTSIGNCKEFIPKSWMNNEPVEVSYRFIEKQGQKTVVGFYTPKFDREMNPLLIIDPEPFLEWGTYYGSVEDDFGGNVITDKAGFVYVTGTTASLNAIASAGAHQFSLDGGVYDAFVAKFRDSGTREWATYYGGSGDDFGSGIAVDTFFNVYVLGTTNSPNGIATAGAFQPTLDGGDDAFLVKLDGAGTRIWGTYYGGADDEKGVRCDTDFDGNIYLVGNTTGSDPYLSTSGAFQENFLGDEDVFIARFTSNGSRDWATYYGGPGSDIGLGISADRSVFVVGATNSTTEIAQTNAYQNQNGGGYDGFIVSFDTLGNYQGDSYFGGDQDDFCTDVISFGVNYFVGYTESDNDISFNALHQTSRNGGVDAFITKFSTTSILDWCTYFGGDEDDFTAGVAVEMNQSVYITGETFSETDISTIDVHQFTKANGSDIFLTKFDELGEQVWGSYYGGDSTDQAVGIDVYGNTSVYISGTSFSDTSMSMEDGHQLSYGGGSDAVFARFTQDICTPADGINCSGGGFGHSGGNGGNNCSGGCVTYSDTVYFCAEDSITLHTVGGSLGTNAEWAWYEGDCGPPAPQVATGDTITILPVNDTTEYFVRGEGITNVTSCVSIIVIKVTVEAEIVTDTIACTGTQHPMEASSGFTFEWSGPNGFSDNSQSTEIDTVEFSDAGIYQLIVFDENGCSDTADVEIFVFQSPELSSTSDSASCYQYSDGSISVTVSGTEPLEIYWPDLGSNNATVTGLSAGSYWVEVTDSVGCVTGDSIVVGEPPSVVLNSSTVSTQCTSNTGTANLDLDPAMAPYTISWDPSGATGENPAGLGYGNHTATIQVSNGCVETHTVFIQNFNGLSVEINDHTDETCYQAADGTAIATPVSGSPTYTYSWSPSGGNSALAENLAPGTYIVSLEDQDGCIAKDTVEILGAEEMLVNADVQQPDCGEDNGFIDINPLGGTGDIDVSWNPQPSGEGGAFSVGTYTVTLTDENNCVVTESFTLEALDNLVVTVDPLQVGIQIGDIVDIFVTTDYDDLNLSYVWSPTDFLSCANCSDPQANPYLSTTYTLTVTHPDDCTGEATVTINVLDECIDVFIPTVFSPNDDGKNDEWCIIANCIKSIDLNLFNRWGELIYKINEPGKCWDGTVRGQKVPNGTYTYETKIELLTGEEIIRSGSVKITR